MLVQSGLELSAAALRMFVGNPGNPLDKPILP